MKFKPKKLMVIVENPTQACEIPVMCTRVGGVDDILAEHDAGILVDPFDYKQWKKELVKLLEKDRKSGIILFGGSEEIEFNQKISRFFISRCWV